MDIALLALTIALILAPAIVGGRITSDGAERLRVRPVDTTARRGTRVRAIREVEPLPAAAPAWLRRTLLVVALLTRDGVTPVEAAARDSVRRA